MLAITNLCKQYLGRKGKKIKALDGITLTMQPGMYGLLGPNGAGKSSLMRTLATLQRPDSGTVKFKGQDVFDNPAAMRATLGYLPQEFGVYDGVSAYDLMDYLARLKGLRQHKVRHQQILCLLEQVNLQDHQHQAVNRFSGGMKQRFGIAQALLNDPDLLIVDEPTAGLDPEERNRFHNILVELSAEKVVLLSTHIVEDVKNLCPNMAILQAGKVISRGTPSQIIDSVQGQIWKAETTPKALAKMAKSLNIISQRLYAGNVTVHVQSNEQPGPDFFLVTPDLEDAYFALLKSATSASQECQA